MISTDGYLHWIMISASCSFIKLFRQEKLFKTLLIWSFGVSVTFLDGIYCKGKGKGLVRLKPCPIGETLFHQQPLGYTATLLTKSYDSSATTILRQAKLSLEPLAPI